MAVGIEFVNYPSYQITPDSGSCLVNLHDVPSEITMTYDRLYVYSDGGIDFDVNDDLNKDIEGIWSFTISNITGTGSIVVSANSD